MEDSDDMISFTKKLGINLWDKKNNSNFFKDDWIESFDLEENKYYFSQLIPNNSVIILALKNETINTIGSNSFFNLTNFTRVENISHCISELNINITTKEYSFLKYIKNEYISNHSKALEIKKEGSENIQTNLLNQTNLRIFKFLRETKFRLPKVHFILNIFHPFFRPGNLNTNQDDKHCIYFDFMLYLTYIEKEINRTLADAIRAGNQFEIGYSHDSANIKIFVFSDVANKTLDEIQKILMNNNAFSNIHEPNNNNTFQMYKELTLEGFLNFRKIRDYNKAKFLFIHGLKENTYKNYEFPTTGFDIEQKCYNIFDKNKNVITNFILDCQIYGYYNIEEAREIVEKFKENPQDEENFQTVVNYAGLENTLKASNFISWIKQFKNITDLKIKSITGQDKNVRKQIFSYIYWSNFNISNLIMTRIFETIVNDIFYRVQLNESGSFRLTVSFIEFNALYLQLRFSNTNMNKTQIMKNINKMKSGIKEKIIEEYKNKSDTYAEPIDLVGDMFYYLKRNIIEKQKSRRAKITKSATDIYNSEFYGDQDESKEIESQQILDLKYLDLLNKFETIYNSSHFDVFYF